MNELKTMFSMLDVLRKEEENYNDIVLEEGQSFQYSFGVLLGEYNQSNKYILNIIDVIKNSKQSNLLRYFALSLRFYFQTIISESEQRLDSINNEIK